MICMTGIAQNNQGRYISGVGVSAIARASQFHVVAHEIGHNFGIIIQ